METDFKEIVDAAFLVAKLATQMYLDENPDDWYPCGFARVHIKPARGKLVAFLKANNIGRTGVYGGYDIYNPSGNHTQCMNAKAAGAKAFCHYIKLHLPDIDISVKTLID